MKDQETIELDLTLIEGIGGESIVLKTTENVDEEYRDCVVKAAPCDVIIEGNFGFIDSKLGKGNEVIPELISTNFEHENIIKYWRTLLRTVDNDLFHFSGKKYKLILFLFLIDILVMDRYSISLWNYLKKFKSDSGEKLDMDDRRAILEKIADAINAIQAKNYCHLDIKPSNILINLEEDGEWCYDLVLTDFGLSGSIDTALGQCGTPGFGSPEQFMGKVHLKSDNYSFGRLAIIVLFPWDIAWDLLSKPIIKADLENENVHQFGVYNSMATFVNVSINSLYSFIIVYLILSFFKLINIILDLSN